MQSWMIAIQIYRITLIFASCCLALVLFMFMVCIIRKTYWSPSSRSSRGSLPLSSSGGAGRSRRRHRRSEALAIAASESSAASILGPGIPFNVRPPFEKPPSYEESQRSMMSLIGTPPPDYPLPLCLSIPAADSQLHPGSASQANQLPSTSSHSVAQEANAAVTSPTPAAGVANHAFQPD